MVFKKRWNIFCITENERLSVSMKNQIGCFNGARNNFQLAAFEKWLAKLQIDYAMNVPAHRNLNLSNKNSSIPLENILGQMLLFFEAKLKRLRIRFSFYLVVRLIVVWMSGSNFFKWIYYALNKVFASWSCRKWVLCEAYILPKCSFPGTDNS